jgi:hypothetical protein
MKPFAQLLLFAVSISLLCGCRGLQSEMQKSRLAAAGPTAMIGGQEFRLEAELKRTLLGDRFDLVGTIKVNSAIRNFPSAFSVNHFALKPCWKGFPGYYAINFTKNKGVWTLPGAYGQSDPNFFATSWTEKDSHVVKFTWRNQGGGVGKKPEHFAAYDVSVTLTDAAGKRHTLSKLGVPTR